MIKKLFIGLVAFITIFLFQSQAWSAVKNSEKIVREINISIDKSTFLVNDDSPSVIALRERKVDSNSKSNSLLWITSIFIAGLGQILMGDMWRGLKFTILIYGLALLAVPLARLYASNYNELSAALAFFLGIGASLFIILIIYIWNIIDAYIMSTEVDEDEISKLNYEKLAELKEKLKVAGNFINTTQISENGVVSVRAFSF